MVEQRLAQASYSIRPSIDSLGVGSTAIRPAYGERSRRRTGAVHRVRGEALAAETRRVSRCGHQTIRGAQGYCVAATVWRGPHRPAGSSKYGVAAHRTYRHRDRTREGIKHDP